MQDNKPPRPWSDEELNVLLDAFRYAGGRLFFMPNLRGSEDLIAGCAVLERLGLTRRVATADAEAICYEVVR